MTDPWTQDPLVREDAELRALLDRLASTATDPVPPEVRAHELEGLLVAVSARTASSATPPWRRRLRSLAAMTSAKVVLAAGVAVAGTGGLAATGSLPDAAQELAHDLGQHVGVGFPDAPDSPSRSGRDAHEHAPGIKATDGTPAREHAPGQTGRDERGPNGPPEDVVTGRQDADRKPPAAKDAGRPDDGPPRRGEAPHAPPAADAVPEAPGERPDTPAPAPRPDDPAADQSDETAPTDTTPAEDAPGESEDAPGRTGQAPPEDPGAAAAPGRR